MDEELRRARRGLEAVLAGLSADDVILVARRHTGNDPAARSLALQVSDLVYSSRTLSDLHDLAKLAKEANPALERDLSEWLQVFPVELTNSDAIGETGSGPEKNDRRPRSPREADGNDAHWISSLQVAVDKTRQLHSPFRQLVLAGPMLGSELNALREELFRTAETLADLRRDAIESLSSLGRGRLFALAGGLETTVETCLASLQHLVQVKALEDEARRAFSVADNERERALADIVRLQELSRARGDLMKCVAQLGNECDSVELALK